MYLIYFYGRGNFKKRKKILKIIVLYCDLLFFFLKFFLFSVDNFIFKMFEFIRCIWELF